MKWITTDYKGNKKVWYSEDVINRIKEISQKSNMPSCMDVYCDCEHCHDDVTENGNRCMQYGLQKIFKLLNEVDV